MAYVNRGRWIANCVLGCSVATEAEHDWYICRLCLNARLDGHRIPLVWPAPADILAVEGALSVRPAIAQNWTPNESIGYLLAQNVEHGLFDPVTGAVEGDVAADQNRLPGLLALVGARLELGP